MKATKQYFPVVLFAVINESFYAPLSVVLFVPGEVAVFVLLYKVVLIRLRIKS